MSADPPPEVTRDGFLGGQIVMAQPRAGAHRSGLDGVLLAAALPPGTSGRVLDLGAGVGVAGLAVAARLADVTVTLAERDPRAADLARRNVADNEAVVGGRAAVVEVDVLDPPARTRAGLAANAFHHVIVNPPFHPVDRGRPSPHPDRADAHAADPADLDRWIRAAAGLVHPRGTLTVIYRADELPRLLGAVSPRFGGIVMLPVHPRLDSAAVRIILRAEPQSRAPFRLLPGFVLHHADGSWRPDADAVLRGAALPAAWQTH